MNIAIVGLGGVGGYLLASLTKTNHNVVGFARGKHLDVIQKNQLKIIEDKKEWSTKVDAKEFPDTNVCFDIVLFCVKSYDLKESFNKIKKNIDKNSILISFSNGVDSSSKLKDWSDSIVLDGCVYIMSHILENGIIRKKGDVFSLVIGGEDIDASRTLESIFKEANLRVKIADNILEAIWKKYIFISAFATLTSYYNESMVSVYNNHYEETKEVLVEIVNVANSIGINIEEQIEKSLNIAKNLPTDASTSMHLDFKNNKKTEIESLTGYIIKIANQKEINVLNMKKMYDELLKDKR